MRAVVVGAGPSGFYAAERLLAAGFAVDMLDALPTPFGLVRSGVAPDHPKIKSVTRVYERTAAKTGFRFFGGVALGEHVSRADLLARYHAVVYALGMADDRRLGIPGEQRPGSHAATSFVSWYNGHPSACDATFDLSVERAVVIGNGNVALDVARMLVLDPAELARTDIADHALVALSRAQVEEVVVLGRRGPAQAAFTNPELRELGELAGADVVVDPAELDLDEHSAASLERGADASARRNLDLLRAFAERGATGKERRISLKFLRSPIAIMGHGADGPTRAIRVARNRLAVEEGGRLHAVPTESEEEISCGLVLRSIGYRGRPVDDVAFDEQRGRIAHEAGRVRDRDGRPMPGEYVVGWIKRGPVGVIGTNKKDALETVEHILADARVGALNEPSHRSGEEIVTWIAERAPDAVHWDHWTAIDVHERRAGERQGRPRVKLVTMQELIAFSVDRDGKSSVA